MTQFSPTVQTVLDIVEEIPRGSVMSYGDVAACAGVGSARFVGRVMARFGDEVPWHRVVMADGSLAQQVAPEQRALLVSEGTPFRAGGDRVDMARARFA